jgi:hypothetical protein
MTHKEDTKLNPWWITGFVDAEGCFSSLSPKRFNKSRSKNFVEN